MADTGNSNLKSEAAQTTKIWKGEGSLNETILLGLMLILLLGISAQWLSWRLRLPSILLLLIFGFVAGPVLNWIKPSEYFGNLIFPFISISVAIILFEGGLSLKLKELRDVGRVVRNLILFGIPITWGLSLLLSHYILHLSWGLSVLFGAVLVVTGPTVILPILKQVRPKGNINSILKWEGIVNDPIGAILAILVFEVLVSSGLGEATEILVFNLAKAFILSGIFGMAGAISIVYLFKKNIIPEYLHNAVTLSFVVFVFAVSNIVQHESGLFAVTLMGIYLANQKKVRIIEIIEFKENLRLLLLSVLFIILASRLELQDLKVISTEIIIFTLLLIIIVRPVSVFVSTLGLKCDIKSLAFISALAPRGIVAAAVVSLFAIELETAGFVEAGLLVPYMFFIIVVTIAVYGLSAMPLAKAFKIADPEPQGCIIIGAHPAAIEIAKSLKAQDLKVVLVDTNRANISRANLEGIKTYYGSVHSEYIFDEIDLTGIGRLLAVTPNKEVNSLAVLYFSRLFGRDKVYQLAYEEDTEERSDVISSELTGKILFGLEFTYRKIYEMLDSGFIFKTNKLTKQYNFEELLLSHGAENIMPMFYMDPDSELKVFTEEYDFEPEKDGIVISLVKENEIDKN